MTIEIVYGAVLFGFCIAVLAIAVSLGRVGKEVKRIESMVTNGLASLAQNVSDIVDTTAALEDRVSELQVDPVSKKIEQAKQEVLTEWINGITEYTPYTGTPHRGD